MSVCLCEPCSLRACRCCNIFSFFASATLRLRDWHSLAYSRYLGQRFLCRSMPENEVTRGQLGQQTIIRGLLEHGMQYSALAGAYSTGLQVGDS
jgi:hypothetical protein